MKTGIAITVRYAGPTNTLGSRWIARADHPEGRVVVSYNADMATGIENAKTAADEMVKRWNARRADRDPESKFQFAIIAGGHTETGYAFVVKLQGPVEMTPRERAAALLTDTEIRGILDANNADASEDEDEG